MILAVLLKAPAPLQQNNIQIPSKISWYFDSYINHEHVRLFSRDRVSFNIILYIHIYSNVCLPADKYNI